MQPTRTPTPVTCSQPPAARSPRPEQWHRSGIDSAGFVGLSDSIDAVGEGQSDRPLAGDEFIEAALLRCAEWSQNGRHRKVLNEIERLLPAVKRQPRREAHLLLWKAQSLIAMACHDRALNAASRSWELEPSPHACHLVSNALYALARDDDAEEALQVGWHLFPESHHLGVQLAMLLADQGRLPEALDSLDRLPPLERLPQELQTFLCSLRANLLATVGRWDEADKELRNGLELQPGASFLHDARTALNRAWLRARNADLLAASWQRGLDPLAGCAGEVDDAICRCGAITERPRLVVLAARRLWRALLAARACRPQIPDAWAAAALLAVGELDGERLAAAHEARAIGVSATTVCAARARFRAFLEGLEPQFARRSFAVEANPRLEEPSSCQDLGIVVAFPASSAKSDSK
jgi:tetratricopeptide (TPR) repeat protein